MLRTFQEFISTSQIKNPTNNKRPSWKSLGLSLKKNLYRKNLTSSLNSNVQKGHTCDSVAKNDGWPINQPPLTYFSQTCGGGVRTYGGFGWRAINDRSSLEATPDAPRGQ